MSSQSSRSRGYSVRARDCSPLPLDTHGPIAASTAACDAHSLTVTTLALGNAAGAASLPVPGYPNSAASGSVSGTSHSSPSMLIFRHGPRNAPSVSSVAGGTATCVNSSSTGLSPSRCRACVSPPVVTMPCDRSQQPQSARVSDSRTQVSSLSSSAKRASAITKYTMTCGGSLPPLRFAPFPVAPTASSTASRGTQDASTPREIQSLSRSSATLPVRVITRDHAGNQPEHPVATRRTNQDQLKLSGIGRPLDGPRNCPTVANGYGLSPLGLVTECSFQGCRSRARSRRYVCIQETRRSFIQARVMR